MNLINPYRFDAGAPAPPLPNHWWNLDDDNQWTDDGELADANWDLIDRNSTVATSAVGPNSQTVATFDGNATGDNEPYLDRTNVGWDGAADGGDYPFTLSAWLNLNSLPASVVYPIMWRNFTLTEGGTGIYANASTSGDYKIGNTVFDTSGNRADCNTDDAAHEGTFNQWFHAVSVWDGTTLRLYIDGTEVETDTNATVGTFDTTSMLFAIGTGPIKGTSGQYMNGEIGMVGIWDKALTADEISTSLYNGGNGNQYADIWT